MRKAVARLFLVVLATIPAVAYAGGALFVSYADLVRVSRPETLIAEGTIGGDQLVVTRSSEGSGVVVDVTSIYRCSRQGRCLLLLSCTSTAGPPEVTVKPVFGQSTRELKLAVRGKVLAMLRVDD
jgi:hypothetical protein